MPSTKPLHPTPGVSSPSEVSPAKLHGPLAPAFCPGLFLDGFIAEGDPDDLVSLLHRQMAWRGLMLRAFPASHG